MSYAAAKPLSLSVMPCRRDARAFRWVIRSPGGNVVARSPYAFATRDGAQISGACWLRESQSP